MYVFIFLVKVTEWPPIGKIAAHLAYNTLPVPHGPFYPINPPVHRLASHRQVTSV